MSKHRFHTVEKQDFAGFEVSSVMCSSGGKRLEVVVDPVGKEVWYMLTLKRAGNRESIYSGPDLDRAIALYNALKAESRANEY